MLKSSILLEISINKTFLKRNKGIALLVYIWYESFYIFLILTSSWYNRMGICPVISVHEIIIEKIFTFFGITGFVCFNFRLNFFTHSVNEVFTLIFKITAQRKPFKSSQLKFPEKKNQKLNLFSNWKILQTRGKCFKLW